LIFAQLEGANLDDAELNNAQANEMTIWPAGFDPHRAGVRIDVRTDTDSNPES
jgi:uncharacterized protein YjbI with pentapeptide repeats